MLMRSDSSDLRSAIAVGVAAALSEILDALRVETTGADSEHADSATQRRALLRKGDRLVAELCCFAGTQVLKPVPLEVLPFLCDFADLLRRTLDARIDVVVEVERECLPWWVDGDALHDALMQLVLNAREAMPAGGRLTFRASVDPVGVSGETLLDIMDTGSGMTAAVLGMAETPFFTTKVGSGLSGMGLPAVGGFAAQAGGRMRISSVEGRGTRVRIALPTIEHRSTH